jgi:hypothetical protein
MKDPRKRPAHADDCGHSSGTCGATISQPTKKRAQQGSSRDEALGERAQKDAATILPESPGQPAGGE